MIFSFLYKNNIPFNLNVFEILFLSTSPPPPPPKKESKFTENKLLVIFPHPLTILNNTRMFQKFNYFLNECI